jgi:hypothetical protein
LSRCRNIDIQSTTLEYLLYDYYTNTVYLTLPFFWAQRIHKFYCPPASIEAHFYAPHLFNQPKFDRARATDDGPYKSRYDKAVTKDFSTGEVPVVVKG